MYVCVWVWVCVHVIGWVVGGCESIARCLVGWMCVSGCESLVGCFVARTCVCESECMWALARTCTWLFKAASRLEKGNLEINSWKQKNEKIVNERGSKQSDKNVENFNLKWFFCRLEPSLLRLRTVRYGPSSQREPGTHCSQVERKSPRAHIKDVFTSKNVRSREWSEWINQRTKQKYRYLC